MEVIPVFKLELSSPSIEENDYQAYKDRGSKYMARIRLEVLLGLSDALDDKGSGPIVFDKDLFSNKRRDPALRSLGSLPWGQRHIER